MVGKRGSGKSYAAAVLGESLLDLGSRVIVLDPVGIWWGLRFRSDGKTGAYEIPVLGGVRGDLELTPESGALVAGALAKSGSSAVLDVSLMRKSGQRTFARALLEELLHLQRREAQPMHVVLEEAQRWAPQRVVRGCEPLLGAAEDLIKLGRNFGIGATLISQRPQSVHKDVLSQTEMLVAFQITEPHARRAVDDWVTEQGAELVRDLPKLAVGDCYVWSPGWLRLHRRSRFRERKTFDASKTPTMGARGRSAKALPKLDLGKLESALGGSREGQGSEGQGRRAGRRPGPAPRVARPGTRGAS